jgi:hypothetical protein
MKSTYKTNCILPKHKEKGGKASQMRDSSAMINGGKWWGFGGREKFSTQNSIFSKLPFEELKIKHFKIKTKRIYDLQI